MYGPTRECLGFFLVLLLLLVVATQADNSNYNNIVPERSNKCVVFDIDGTITFDTFETVLIRRKSQDALWLYLDLGYQVVLVTARRQLLEWYTRMFLSMWGFPVDELSAMVFAEGRLSTHEEKRTYKRTALQNLSSTLACEFQYAYGDSVSDFEAYEDVGIDKSRVFALQRYFTESTCLEGSWAECLHDYTDHLEYIQDQPFAL